MEHEIHLSTFSFVDQFFYGTTNLPVEEAERVRHGVADVGQTKQHQRDTQDGIKDGHHFAPLRLGRDMTITCERIRFNAVDCASAFRRSNRFPFSGYKSYRQSIGCHRVGIELHVNALVRLDRHYFLDEANPNAHARGIKPYIIFFSRLP